MVECPQPNWMGFAPMCNPRAHDPAQYCPGPSVDQLYTCPGTAQQKPGWVLCGDGRTWCDPFIPNLRCPPVNGETQGRQCGDSRPCLTSCGPCDNGTLDGCGGTCKNDCGGRRCGLSDKGCNCGTCPSGQKCNGSGQCERVCVPTVCPKCSDVETDDGCGGKCPATTKCPPGKRCNPTTGACEDEPCVKRPCNPCSTVPTSDGCGGACPVAKGCDGRVCGPSADGCVASCGACPKGKVCSKSGTCVDDGSGEKDPMRYRPPHSLVEVQADAVPTQRIGFHALLFVNGAKEHLYVGMISNSRVRKESLSSLGMEDLTGFLLPSGKAYLAYVPLNHSGRIWTRSSCRWYKKPEGAYKGMPVDGLDECTSLDDLSGCVMACDAGSCGAANGLAGNYICGSDSGVPPATLFEFTWGSNEADEDTWDISNVDGHNIGMRVDVVGGTVTPGRSAECQINQPVEEWCPNEVLWRGTVNPGTNYCSSICKAVTDDSYEARAPDPETRQLLANLKAQREPWSGGPMTNFLCCDCGAPGGKCEDDTETPSSTCYYGCSPYQTKPFNAAFENRRCFAKRRDFEAGTHASALGGGKLRQIGWSSIGMGKQDILDGKLRDVPDWPAAGPPAKPPPGWKPEKNWAEIYSDLCPQAYSWQFKDLTSTYHARGAIGYKITFLPRPGAR